MIKALKLVFSIVSVWGVVFFLFACDDAPPPKKRTNSSVVQKRIVMPSKAAKAKIPAAPKIKPDIPASQVIADKTAVPSVKSKENPSDNSNLKEKPVLVAGPEAEQKSDHYNSKGKIDPFKPLIQDRSEEEFSEKPVRPKRILTPLEKIGLSQIRLVAVIQMKDKKIAMVEEANGKGYEVGIGTYIGKNQGRVSDITSSSILVKELIRDYRGRVKEKMKEIKLNKLSDGE